MSAETHGDAAKGLGSACARLSRIKQASFIVAIVSDARLHAGLAPEPSISVISAAQRAEYRAVPDKGYHARIELVGGEPATVLQSLEHGADAWWTVDAAALPAPNIVTERQANLRETCYATIARCAASSRRTHRTAPMPTPS
ncbi:hypothetical protein [Achromobacter spanius]|uniref:hypothetical protein n=1 Tax=Achromobacter spanius TaxID=217203 RepID=UPI00131A013B|nr:hypothetical protein [Achromobacter spanius]